MKNHLMRATNTFAELIGLYAGVLLACAAAYAALEHKSLADAFWWAIVTATTTGYGDQYPVTAGGRVVAGVLMHMTLLLILPLLIGRIINTLMENRHEWTDAEQKRLFSILVAIRIQTASKPWVISNAEKTMFRGWDSLGPIWVSEIDAALKFYDRPSAERFCAEDEDAWSVFQPERT